MRYGRLTAQKAPATPSARAEGETLTKARALGPGAFARGAAIQRTAPATRPAAPIPSATLPMRASRFPSEASPRRLSGHRGAQASSFEDTEIASPPNAAKTPSDATPAPQV